MKKISEDIKNGTFEHIYLLYGEEAYLRNLYKKRLLEALGAEKSGMNFTVFTGEDMDENAVISAGETLPFFAERRVILLDGTGVCKKKNELLAAYVKDMPSYLYIVIADEQIDKRGKLYKEINKNGYAAAFGTQSEDVLTRWVLGILKKEGKNITRNDMRLFLSMTGTDMSMISQELEKLICYTMDKDVVTREDIEAVCIPQITSHIFDMVAAVSEHRQQDALNMYYELLALKEPPMRILFLLARQFNQLFLMKGMQNDGLPAQTIASKAGVPPFVVRKSAPVLKRYRESELLAAVKDFVQAEQDVKTGRLDDRLSVELMIIKYSGGQKNTQRLDNY